MRIVLAVVTLLILVIGLVGGVRAQEVEIYWDGEGTDDLWSNPLNWAGDTVPTAADFAINTVPSETMLIDSSVSATARRVRIGEEDGPSSLDITGGTLDLVADDDLFNSGSLVLGFGGGTIDAGKEGTLNMSGGTLSVARNLLVGHFGTGVLNQTGGTINITAFLTLQEVGGAFGGTGHVQLDGGLLDVNVMALKEGGSIDITRGTMVLDTVAFSVQPTIEDLVASGHITGYGGAGSVIVDKLITPDRITLTAIPEPNGLLLLSVALAGLHLISVRRH